MDNRENRLTWLPFHFLPGNGGLAAGSDPQGTFVDKLVCTPDSHIANDMLEYCIAAQHKTCHLQRLGISMHVYADTFAHQGFAGVRHEINNVTTLKETGGTQRLPDGIGAWRDKLLNQALPPVGHGRALTLPDMPFLAWSYTNGRGITVARDNTTIFLDAADALCRAMQRYRAGNAVAPATGLLAADRQCMRDLFATQTSTDASVRHRAWLAAIHDGMFSFGSATISYDPTGTQCWKSQALGTTANAAAYHFHPGFLTTRWKFFHDALQEHRLTVLHDILPKYGICAG